MSRSTLRRSLAVFLPALCLFAGLAAAAPLHSPAGPEPVRFTLETVISFLRSALTKLWEKEGGSLDPNGLTRTGQGADAGPSLDPNGGPDEAGPSLDPDGVR
jgi:hypothetical protein